MFVIQSVTTVFRNVIELKWIKQNIATYVGSKCLLKLILSLGISGEIVKLKVACLMQVVNRAIKSCNKSMAIIIFKKIRLQGFI